MKDFTLHAVLSCIMLSAMICCSKTPEKQVKEFTSSNKNMDSVKTTPSAVTDSADTAENSLTLKIKDYINSQYLRPEDQKTIDASDRTFNLSQIDLNNDGKKEIFINFFTPYFCGSGGCTLLLLDSDLKLINRFTVMRTPITIDSKTEDGWKVLWLQDGNSWKMLTPKNGKYPSNPSIIKDTKEIPERNSLKLFNTTTSKKYSF